MDKLEFALHQLDGYLITQRQLLYRTLNDGIEDLKGTLLSSKLKRLYAWHNGQSVSFKVPCGQFDFCSFGKFLSFEDATRLTPNEDLEGWPQASNFFPLVSSMGGDFLLVDKEKESSKIYLYSPSITFSEIEPVFSSLESFLTTVYMCIEKGAYAFDAEGYLDVDVAVEATIAKRYNKGIEFWD